MPLIYFKNSILRENGNISYFWSAFFASINYIQRKTLRLERPQSLVSNQKIIVSVVLTKWFFNLNFLVVFANIGKNDFNPFSTNVLLLYHLKTSENRRFSNVFRGSEFWNYEIELRNRVTQNDAKLRVTKSKMFIEILLSSY